MNYAPKPDVMIVDFNDALEIATFDGLMRIELKRDGEIVGYIRCPVRTARNLRDNLSVALDPPV
jgi:hypothetical protein